MLACLRHQREYGLGTKAVVVGFLVAPWESGDRAATGGGRGIPTVLAVGGCDKANTAHILTCLLEAAEPSPLLVLQVGIAGAFTGASRAVTPGDVVVATEEIYADTGSSSPSGWLSADQLGLPLACVDGCVSAGRFVLDDELVREAAGIVDAELRRKEDGVGVAAPRTLTGRCLTSSQVTGLDAQAAVLSRHWGALAESMEGAAAAHMCAFYGVPFLEIRGISNLIGDRDRDSWHIDRAVAVAAQAALAVCAAFAVDLTAGSFRGRPPVAASLGASCRGEKEEA